MFINESQDILTCIAPCSNLVIRGMAFRVQDNMPPPPLEISGIRRFDQTLWTFSRHPQTLATPKFSNTEPS